MPLEFDASKGAVSRNISKLMDEGKMKKKQAIAIALNQARKAGANIPPPKRRYRDGANLPPAA